MDGWTYLLDLLRTGGATLLALWVDRECRTLDAAAALMRKWNESRLVDAVGREAKSRAIKILGM